MATKKKVNAVAGLNLVEQLAKEEREAESLKQKDDNYHIDLSEYIEVKSLYPGKLNLSTEKMGKGRPFSFSEFGERKRILYNDLASIMENYRTFMEKGYFYILSEKVVRKHGLDDMYSRILSESMIEKILNCDKKLAVKLYESATPAQREVIDGMLVQEIKDGDPDLNIINQISKISKKDLIQLAEEAKEIETGIPA